MILRSVLAATAILSATSVSAADVGYRCVLGHEIGLFFIGSEYGATSSLTVANQYPYKTLELKFGENGQVDIGVVGASLNLSGPVRFSEINENQKVWSSPEPKYCGVIDAKCLSNATFQVNSDGTFSLLVQTIGTANAGARRSIGLASIALQYNCERES